MPDGLSAAERPDIGQVDHRFDLREAVSFLWRQWKFIAAVTAVVFAIGAVMTARQTPLYTATSQVLLERPSAVPPGGDTFNPDIRLDLPLIESQISVIRSTVFLRRVVEKEGLASPPPAGQQPAAESASSSFLGRARSFFLSLIGRGGDRSATEPAPTAADAGSDGMPLYELHAIEGLKSAITVTRGVPLSYVLAISVTSPSPGKAAQLANAVTDAYLVDKLDTRFDAAKRASAWLSDRLGKLRDQVRDAEEAVAQFRADHGLVQSNGVTLSQQQLSDLNAKLIDAKADLAQKKARVDLLGSIQAKGGSIQSMPEIANAGGLAALRQQAAQLSAQEADLLARYGASHPLVVNIRAQLRDVEGSIGAEAARLAGSVKNDYELAQAKVASLEKSVGAATGQSNIDDATAIHLRELERTATVNRTLFEDFLKQSKITQEQSTYEPQDVRIISPAVPPGAPSYPRKGRLMTISLVLGLLLGVVGALAKEKLNTGFTTPKQIEEMLGLPLLTSISRITSRDLAGERGSKISIYEMPTVKPLSRFGEAIRALRSGVHMTDVDNPPKVVQVTSTVPGEGKTTVALSLASSAASAKLKVLFIDADLRHPSATHAFGLNGEAGLVDLLLGDVAIENAVQFYEQGGHWALGAGNKTQNPTDLLGSERMRSLVGGFKDAYDLVILDTPPAGPLVDPVVVSHLADKIVLVVRWGSTARELVKECVIQLSGHRKIAGVAFNYVDEREAQKYGKYAYSYYYGRRYYKRYYTQ